MFMPLVLFLRITLTDTAGDVGHLSPMWGLEEWRMNVCSLSCGVALGKGVLEKTAP